MDNQDEGNGCAKKMADQSLSSFVLAGIPRFYHVYFCIFEKPLNDASIGVGI
jgi:hypothetical protein